MNAAFTKGPLAALLERLKADGGRYLLSVAMTREEIDAAPKPTYGNKGTKRWLTEDERAALMQLSDEHAQLSERNRVLAEMCTKLATALASNIGLSLDDCTGGIWAEYRAALRSCGGE